MKNLKKFCQKKSIFKKITQQRKNYNKNYKSVRKTKNNNSIYICGNGGSASDAEHLSTEFLVRLRPKVKKKAL